MSFTTQAGDFQWLDGPGDDECLEIGQGETLKTIIMVNPGVGLNFNSPFSIFYDDVLSINFQDDGPTPPLLSVAPNSLDSGSVEVGSSSNSSFTATNDGGGTLTLNATTSGPFSIVSQNSFTLAAGQSRTITVQFSPTQEGSFSGSVSLDTNGGDVTVSLSGTGVAQPPVLVISTSLLNFGNIAVNDSATRSYTVTNTGGGTLPLKEPS